MATPISPEIFLRRVKGLAFKFSSDPEVFHSELDELMEKTLTDLGYGEGIEAISDGPGRYYA